MAAKPSIALARWADQLGANLLTPSSGLRDLGLQAGTPAVAGYVNDELHQLYLWALYVDGGVLDGDVTLNGSLTIGGQLVTFADFTYTADSSTDRLTRTAHGLQTGYGPVRTSNSGGALPSGLLAATDYYVIRVDADHLRLAATRTDALAGFAIDFLTNGTGTQTLLHQSSATLPTDASVSRNLAVTGALTAGSGAVGGAAFSFPSTVFTANSTTDQLAIDAHGLETGWGPMRVSNSGGALPTGLLAATDYWVIRINSGKFSLATSFSNAMAGTAIDLTTAGTGTNSIVSGTSPTQAGSLSVNGDLTVAGVIRHGDSPDLILPAAAAIYVGSIATQASGAVVSLGGVSGCWGIPLHAGQTVKSLVIWVSGDGVVDLVWAVKQLLMTASNSVTNTLAGAIMNNIPGGTGLTSWTAIPVSLTATTIQPGSMISVFVDSSGANLVYGSLEVTYGP